ncbi:hypothetical protein BDC45DRAFT_574319 [Circinella umbellata]|nr:hypothetical protein BDC45DRAFT_574319 [Circinella umbellata]
MQQQRQQIYNDVHAVFKQQTQLLLLLSASSIEVFTAQQQQKLYHSGDLQCHCMGGLERDWDRLLTLSLPKLTYLHIKMSDVIPAKFLSDQGRGYHDVIADEIFNAIGELRNLSSLHLSYSDIRYRVFRDLLDRYELSIYFPEKDVTLLANCRNLSILLLYKVNGAGKDRVGQLLRPYIKNSTVQRR